MEAIHTITQVICYITDASILIQDARRLILSDGKPKPSIVQVQAHKDVLAYMVAKGQAQQLGNDFIAFV